jgi:Fe-S-cluster-containing dehydrogenase component
MSSQNPDQPDRGTNTIDLKSLAEERLRMDENNSQRSPQEQTKIDEFMEHLKDEYPSRPEEVNNLNRRDFMKLVSASLILAGLSACVPQPNEKLVPYVNPPADVTPGKYTYYATAMEVDGYARGLLVKSTMGRPLKAEGNPSHPASLGATDPFGQAALLDLYDPDRSQVVRNQNRISTWDNFQAAFLTEIDALSTRKGAGLRILSGPITSPTLTAQMNALMDRFPQARWYQYAPVDRDNVYTGTQMAFGKRLQPVYRFDRARMILSIDADITLREPGWVRYSHDFMQGRRVLNGDTAMNRLYSVETRLTNMSALADHHLPLHPGEIEPFVRALAQGIGVSGISGQSPVPADWLSALVNDIREAPGQSLVIVGEQQPPQVHALGFAINSMLGNIGQTVYFTQSVEAAPQNGSKNLSELVNELNQDKVDVLLVLDQNAVYNAPVDLDFINAYQKARTRIYLGLYDDETAEVSTWHVPAAHFLETWGDIRAFDGTVSIIQPLIEPLYAGRTAYELLAMLLGQPQAKVEDIVREFWQGQTNADGMLAQTVAQFPVPPAPVPSATQIAQTSTPAAADSNTPFPTLAATASPADIQFQKAWELSLKSGVVLGSAFAPVDVSLALDLATVTVSNVDRNQLVLIFEPDPTVWDGRWANNAWLQELPKRLTKLTWDNAALVSPVLASQLSLNDEDVIQLQVEGRSVLAPVYILPGQPEKAVTLHLGYGRKRGGKILAGHGFDAYQLRTSTSPWIGYDLRIQKTGESYPLATTQHHQTMDGRDLARAGDLRAYLQNPQMFKDPIEEKPPSLYPPYEYNQKKWGMSINLNACVGCAACVIACQAENNIPVVGKEQVLAEHEMHWLRVDRYFEGKNVDDPNVLFQPVPCMHCEDAPCEYVCPVEATQHDEEGLNEMIYNRCIGTRYCSNNCPYKVRRFNFLQFSDLDTTSLKMVRNPEVTVRFRGVMEKCTYCVQRIRNTEIQAEVEGREVAPAEVQTACQQVCPTNAIVFGDLNNSQSPVTPLKQEPRDYRLLAELGTRPRTTYLAKLRNPNPRIQQIDSLARP